MSAAASRSLAVARCVHCGLPVAREGDSFCCDGCRAVHELIVAGDLGRYYELRGERGVPIADARSERHDLKWLEAVEERCKASPGAARVDLDVQGLHCSACVWLIETLFERRGGGRIAINPSVGRAHMVVAPSFDLRDFVSEVERFGYRFGPPVARPLRRSNELLWRLGVTVAIAMNTMIFAIAVYAGLRSGPLHDVFETLNLALSTIAVVVGGGVFFRSAWAGLRRRVLHLDVPIALGIALAWTGSVIAYFEHRSSGIFVDTLDVFIALMLLGRLLQEKVLERNRAELLENDGADGLLARRRLGDAVETVRSAELRVGDAIVVASGDLVPVDARVTGESASFSLDWINGEAEPHAFARGDVVPAGAFSAAASPATLVVERDFASSGLVELLRTPLARAADAAMGTPWWDALSKVYSAAVLALAAIGFVAWMLATHDLARALEVTTAVLVVTCPCAFGIATPLAYDLAYNGLRRAGLFVRTPTFLDRATRVRRVVFDKTGTLTSGLRVRDASAIDALAPEARSALRELAAATWHPKSAAVLAHVRDARDAGGAGGVVREHAGFGVSLERGGSEWRLGAPAWVDGGAPPVEADDADVAFGRDGRRLAAFVTDEQLRPDARREVAALGALGCEVWLLSGDDAARTAVTAGAAGIPREYAIGALGAQEKADWITQHDHSDTLMVGDGINDGFAVEQAFCSGTPAVDRPFMAARSDFYFVTPGLQPVRLALEAARRVARVRNRNLGLALAYNVLTIGLAYAGLMSPLLCAVLMPASSLTTVLSTVGSLSPRSATWKS